MAGLKRELEQQMSEVLLSVPLGTPVRRNSKRRKPRSHFTAKPHKGTVNAFSASITGERTEEDTWRL